ncbi:MAG: ABC transporter ATP-binding protein [Microcoleaceae cyanobacterium]
MSYSPPHSIDSTIDLTPELALEPTGVRVDNLTFSYGKQVPILQDISFNLKVGECIALLGRTGTGKSTLMENLVGLKQPNSGEIRILGTRLEADTLAQIRRQVGFCFQDANDQLFMPSILEDVSFGPRNYGVSSEAATEQAYQLLADFGLADVVNRSAHELSGGQKRLAALASVLALEPDILILDEPTNGLDPWWRRHLAILLPQLPIKVLLVASHDLHWVSRVAERAMVLQDGKIKVDMPSEDLLRDQTILDSCGLPLNY